MPAVAGRLTWDGLGEKKFQRGVSQVVLYLYNPTTQKWEGVAWNGCRNMTDSPEGGDAEDYYADNQLYASLRGVEKLKGSGEVYTWPDEFDKCVGKEEISTGISVGQQPKAPFCVCYRSEVGTDQNPNAGYVLNLIYNATADAVELSHDTDEESPQLEPISFNFSCTPVPVPGKKPTSKLEIKSLTTPAEKLTLIENALYGTESVIPYMPMPAQLIELITG